MVEFAAVFVLFVLLLSGLIQYGVIFAAQQSLSHAASEATRAVVNVADANDDGSAEDEVTERIEEVLDQQASWLDGAIVANDAQKVDYVVDFSGCDACVEVTVTYNWEDDPLVPSLFRIATPSTLTGSANARYR